MVKTANFELLVSLKIHYFYQTFEGVLMWFFHTVWLTCHCFKNVHCELAFRYFGVIQIILCQYLQSLQDTHRVSYITFKLLLISFKALTAMQHPKYIQVYMYSIRELLSSYKPSHSLRSRSRNSLSVPTSNLLATL